MPDLFERELAAGARLTGFVVDSEALAGNPMGDPAERMHPMLVPAVGGADLPLVVLLTGFTGFGFKVLSKTSLWDETLPERLARLMNEECIPPAVFLWPSCETKLGGAQYMNSPATGDYETMLLEELIPAVEQATGAGGVSSDTHESVSRRVIAGKSSGGYGALTLVMRNPGFFCAAACHSGDMAFDLSQYRGFPEALTCWKKYGGPQAFMDAMSRGQSMGNLEHGGLDCLAMSSCYSPNADASLGFDLPVDPETGAFQEDVFARWLEKDPIHMVEKTEYASALKKLDLLFLDCGETDEFALQWALRRFLPKLDAAGVPYESNFWDGGHFRTDHRYEVSLPRLLEACR